MQGIRRVSRQAGIKKSKLMKLFVTVFAQKPAPKRFTFNLLLPWSFFQFNYKIKCLPVG
jgi:hypothetical protein